ncbi:MAG: DUF1835 domain-containing protein [Bacteroidota bacterium]
MTYHILNGDALKQQFPSELAGEVLVCKECLIDGPVKADSLQAFYQLRMAFLQQAYGASREKYLQTVQSQFEAILAIPEGAKVHLWFEDDLFCQINCWFVCALLAEKSVIVRLVRPVGSNLQYGFGGLSSDGLVSSFQASSPMSRQDLSEFAQLWRAYQAADLALLQQLGQNLQEAFPFLMPAIDAHIARIPTEENIGRPSATILEIMEVTASRDFGTIFQEFSKRESIYGFGDLQLRRLYDQIAE